MQVSSTRQNVHNSRLAAFASSSIRISARSFSLCRGGSFRIPIRRCRQCAAASRDISPGLDERLAKLAKETATDEEYQQCATYLRELGIDNRAELARIMDIATNPRSIYSTFQGKKGESNSTARKLSVDADLKPLVACLLEQGLSQKDITKVIVEHPLVLCYSPKDKIQPFMDYLRSLGIASPAATILQRPSLLGLDGEKSLRQIVDYLQANEYTPEQIENLLCNSI